MLYRKIKLSTFGLYLKAVSKLWLVPLLTVNVLVPVISAVLYKNGGAGAESDIVTVMYFLLPISTVWTSIFVSEFFFSDRTRDVLFFYSRKKRFAVSQLFFLLPLANVAAVTLLHFRCLSYSVSMAVKLLCIGVLLIFDIPYEDFAIGGDIVNMMLGPATAVLALNIYNQYAVLKRHFVPVLVGCTAGSLFSLASVLLLCRLFRLDEAVTAALLPKSCTTPIAVGIAESHGGIAAITMVAVLVTGFIGAVCAPLFAKLMHVTEPVAEGLAIGACSHALGTTKAAELGEVQGAMSGIAIGVCGLITVVAALFL